MSYYTEQLYRRQETELAINIRKATSIEEISPKRTCASATTPPPGAHSLYRKACASMHRLYLGPQELGVLLAGHESVGFASPRQPFRRKLGWHDRDLADSGSRQPILADEIQTFKALITVHKVLQEGHPIVLKEAQSNTSWLESLSRGTAGDGARGYSPLISEYIYYLLAKLAFHRQHPEFNGMAAVYSLGSRANTGQEPSSTRNTSA